MNDDRLNFLPFILETPDGDCERNKNAVPTVWVSTSTNDDLVLYVEKRTFQQILNKQDVQGSYFMTCYSEDSPVNILFYEM